jgi:hypothetical protein
MSAEAPNEWVNSSSTELPLWATRSSSVYPGTVTAQRSVLTGIWCLSKVPGLVRP